MLGCIPKNHKKFIIINTITTDQGDAPNFIIGAPTVILIKSNMFPYVVAANPIRTINTATKIIIAINVGLSDFDTISGTLSGILITRPFLSR
ncbi:hypothetical protein D3C76_974170 [compost metagenome]